MNKRIFSIWFFLFISSIIPTPLHASEVSPPSQMSEILNLLSKGKPDKAPKEEKKSPPSLKSSDIKTTVDLLQNKKEREKIIKVLTALMEAKAEVEKKEALPNPFTEFVTSLIDTTSEILINCIRFFAQTPAAFQDTFHRFSDSDYQRYLLDIIGSLFLAIVVSIGIENVARLLMARLRLHRPQTYTLLNLPQHILRNCIPVILFGIFSYIIVFYYPFSSPAALDKSFILITALIMMRTFFMVLKVLFISRHINPTDKKQASFLSSYQFAVAIVQVLLTGIIFAELGQFLGADNQMYQVWLKILSFGVVSLLILAIWKIRFWGKSQFEFEDEKLTNLSAFLIRIVQFAGNYWHWLATIALGLSFLLYFIGMANHSLFVAKAIVLTALLTSFLLLARNMLQKVSLWLEADTHNHLSLILSTPPRQALLNFCQFILHFLYFILLFQIWGADPLGLLTDKNVHPYLASTVSILLILTIYRFLWVGTNYIVTAHIQPKKLNGKIIEPSLFAKTIAPILQSIGHWVLTLTTIILILEEVGIPIMPIIYGISVIGIAISLGAQSLVKDLINGILTLMEGNMAVGETVVIGSYTGMVESLSLRGVSLRHGDGSLQTIPFSEVSSIINKSRDFTSITIELPFPYGTSMTQIKEVLEAAYQETLEDPLFKKMTIEPVSIAGIERFTETGFVIMGSIKIKADPKKQFVRAFNQRLKNYLEAAHITPPATAQTVIINNADDKKLDFLSPSLK